MSAALLTPVNAKSENNTVIKCAAVATDEDFYKTRLNIAAATTENAMMLAAKNAFKSKCFSTEQVKNLSVLFLKDEGKYSFFEAAYPFVTDSEQFNTLESQLTDEYYINRFKAMIHH